MKKLFTLLLCCLCLHAMAHNTTLAKLTEVNHCWAEQPDVAPDALPAWQPQGEHEWIRTHLRLVEATLRRRDVHHLSAVQQRHRFQCLDYLRTYWQTGNFPINDQYAFRTPICIDPYNNFCAVGYLLKASGNEGVSRMIAAKTNLAYVKEMKYPEVTAWAADNGFTVAELAWIQPGYSPDVPCSKVGNGVLGTVYEMYADDAEGKLYVGGRFSLPDGSGNENIAYVTESGGTYTWHQMGTGINGEVRAITQYHGTIYAAGQFLVGGTPANVAVWDGTAWASAGCVDGTVYDLAVAGDELYAAGEFGACDGSVGRNLARWNGTNWMIMAGMTGGKINTIEPNGSGLIVGGVFAVDTALNVARWTPENGYTPLAGSLNNEVMDFEYFRGTLYAACRRTDAVDVYSLIMKLNEDGWHDGMVDPSFISRFEPLNGNLSFNTLCGTTSGLDVGGQYSFWHIMGVRGRACYNLFIPESWTMVDSIVNKMVRFKGRLILGGAFRTGVGVLSGGLNNIAQAGATTAVTDVNRHEETITLHPNPARTGTQVTTTAYWNGANYRVADATGRTVAEGNVTQATIDLPNVPAGLYIVTMITTAGQKQTTKLTIQ